MGFAFNYALNLVSLFAGSAPLRPLLFSYYVTHRCPLNCTYCSDGVGRRFNETPGLELSTKEAFRLISILARSTDTLDITGGEPMIREDLEELLAHAKRQNLRVVLNTKAHDLHHRPDLLRLSDVLVISVDSLDPIHLSRLQGTSPQIASKTLETLDYLRKDSTQNRPQVVLSSVACPENLPDVADVLQYAMANGFGFHVSPENVGTQLNPKLRNHRNYVNLIKTIETAKKQGAVLGVPEYLRGIRNFTPYHCHPQLMPTIRPDGHLYYPCLESGLASVSILTEGSYEKAMQTAKGCTCANQHCRDQCVIFCHMALSLFQRHPLSAIGEGRCWRRIRGASHSGLFTESESIQRFKTKGES